MQFIVLGNGSGRGDRPRGVPFVEASGIAKSWFETAPSSQVAEQRGLKTWEQLAAYAGEEWYPSRIAFGKHKGKSLTDAGRDAGFREWLEGLAR